MIRTLYHETTGNVATLIRPAEYGIGRVAFTVFGANTEVVILTVTGDESVDGMHAAVSAWKPKGKKKRFVVCLQEPTLNLRQEIDQLESILATLKRKVVK